LVVDQHCLRIAKTSGQTVAEFVALRCSKAPPGTVKERILARKRAKDLVGEVERTLPEEAARLEQAGAPSEDLC
jgi:hypothetical protein